MIVSETTLEILKNFSSINTGIVLREGQSQMTWTPDRNMYASVLFREEIPLECGIFDLRTLVSSLEAFDVTPDVQFEEKAVWIKSGVQKIKYVYCLPETIDLHFRKSFGLKLDVEGSAVFTISSQDMKRIRKVAQFMALPNFVIQFDGTQIQIIATDTKNTSSNRTVVTIDQSQIKTHPTTQFCFSFPAEYIHKLLEGGYTIHVVESRKYGRFVHEELPLTYTISAVSEKNLVTLTEE